MEEEARDILRKASVAGREWECTPPNQRPKASQPLPNDRVVLSIGDQKMTAGEVEQIIQALPPDYRAFYSGQGKRRLAVYILRMKLLFIRGDQGET